MQVCPTRFIRSRVRILSITQKRACLRTCTRTTSACRAHTGCACTSKHACAGLCGHVVSFAPLTTTAHAQRRASCMHHHAVVCVSSFVPRESGRAVASMLSYRASAILCACMRACGVTSCGGFTMNRSTQQQQQRHSQRLMTRTKSTDAGDSLASVSPDERNGMSRYDDGHWARTFSTKTTWQCHSLDFFPERHHQPSRSSVRHKQV
jgi:hypothetical protein